MGLIDNWQMAKIITDNRQIPENLTERTEIENKDIAPQTGTISRSGRSVQARFGLQDLYGA